MDRDDADRWAVMDLECARQKKQKILNIIRQNFTALLSEQSSQIYPSQRDNVQL